MALCNGVAKSEPLLVKGKLFKTSQGHAGPEIDGACGTDVPKYYCASCWHLCKQKLAVQGDSGDYYYVENWDTMSGGDTHQGRGKLTMDIASGVANDDNMSAGTNRTIPVFYLFKVILNIEGSGKGKIKASFSRGGFKISNPSGCMPEWAVLNACKSNASALSCNFPKSALFVPEGEAIVLEAEAASGSTFEGWHGDISGSDNPKTVTITRDLGSTPTKPYENSDFDKLITARFTN